MTEQSKRMPQRPANKLVRPSRKAKVLIVKYWSLDMNLDLTLNQAAFSQTVLVFAQLLELVAFSSNESPP